MAGQGPGSEASGAGAQKPGVVMAITVRGASKHQAMEHGRERCSAPLVQITWQLANKSQQHQTLDNMTATATV